MSDTPLPLFTLTLTGTTKIQEVLTLDGRSSKTYAFAWDSRIGRYAFRTASATELNDLLEQAGCSPFHAFSLILPEQTTLAAPQAPTPPTPLAQAVADPVLICPFAVPADAHNLERSQAVQLLNGLGLYAGPKEETKKLTRVVEGVFAGYALAVARAPLIVPAPKPIPPASEPESAAEDVGGVPPVATDGASPAPAS